MLYIKEIWKRITAVFLVTACLVTAVPAVELREDAESYSVHTTALTSLEASAGTWNKAFAGDETKGYVLTLGPEETEFRLNALSAEPDPNVCPTIRIDGQKVTQGMWSQAFSLEIGEKRTILIETESRRDGYSRTYEVTAYRTDLQATLRAIVGEPIDAEGHRVAQIDFLLPEGTTLNALSLWMRFDAGQMQLCQENGEIPQKLSAGKVLGPSTELKNSLLGVRTEFSNETGLFQVDFAKKDASNADYTVSDGEKPVLRMWFVLGADVAVPVLELENVSVSLTDAGLSPYYESMVQFEGFTAETVRRPEREDETTPQGYALDWTGPEYDGSVIAAYAFSEQTASAAAVEPGAYSIRGKYDGLVEVEPIEELLDALEMPERAAAVSARTEAAVGTIQNFSMRDFRKSGVAAEGWTEGPFRLMAVSALENAAEGEIRELRFWLSTDEDRGVLLSEEDASTLAEYFALCYAYLATELHPIRDTNGNGSLDILLYDIYDDYTEGGSSYTGGFVNANEFFCLLGTETYPFGNNGDVVHLDVNPQLNHGAEALISTMAHETQHMCMYSAFEDMAAFREGQPPTWINEGLSMTVEDALFGPLASRVYTFNTSSAIKNGMSLTDWSGTVDDYALSYLFFQYVREQTGDEDFAKAFYRSYDSGNVPETILQTFECFSGKVLDEILQNFYLALFLREETGPYGVGDNEALQAVQPQCLNAVPEHLAPTGAVYVTNSDTLVLLENPQLQFVGVTVPVVEPDDPDPTPTPTPSPEPEEPEEPTPVTPVPESLHLAQVILTQPNLRGLLPQGETTAIGFDSTVNEYDLHLLSTDPEDVILQAVCKEGSTAALSHVRGDEMLSTQAVPNYAGDQTLQEQTVSKVQDGDEIELRVTDTGSGENIYRIHIHRTDAEHDPTGSVSFQDDEDGLVRMKVQVRNAVTNAVTVTVPFLGAAPVLYDKDKAPFDMDKSEPKDLSLLSDAAYEVVSVKLRQEGETYLLELTVAIPENGEPVEEDPVDLVELYCQKGENAPDVWYGETADMALYDLNRIYLDLEIPTKAEITEGQTVTGSFLAYKAEEYTQDGEFQVCLANDETELKASAVTVEEDPDAQGLYTFHYTFDAVPDGIYILVVNKPGHTPLRITNIGVSGADYTVRALPTLTVGDVDGDGWVRTRDKALLTAMLGLAPEGEEQVCDLDGDGRVRTRDLALLSMNLGLGTQEIEEEDI